ncbi:MAG: tetratricopeptide repeat protein, partial [Pseudomonadota bacterium]
MDTLETTISMKALAVSTAMAGALLSGCAATPAPRADVSATQAQAALAEGRVDRGTRLAEQAVQAEPRNAAYRAMLGKAYLDAGRFASAETSFND